MARFVNGVRTTRHVLADGDLVRVGEELLIFRTVAPAQRDESMPALVGRSPSMSLTRVLLSAAAPSSATLLLLGETGTGKSVAARAVHRLSGRTGPFVAVNSAAIPHGVLESALFGHVSGAFTDAKSSHLGFFRKAHQGTLFLDEIGDLSFSVQAKLLTAVEDKAVVPVGAVDAIPIDIRLIAATNIDVERAVAEGRFRGDLSARLSEIIVRLPALRERREDILALMVHCQPEAQHLPLRVAEAALLYSWPSNVRELQQLVSEWSVLSPAQPALAQESLLARLRPPTSAAVTSSVAPAPPAGLQGVPSRTELEQLLREHRGNITLLAQRTGRSRKQVYRWLDHHGLDPTQFR